MSLLTIVEASKQFNVGRTAIYKAIKKGELTAQINHDGTKVVDVQDMIRVFGSSAKKAVSQTVSETEKNNIEKQKKQPETQVETALETPKTEEKKGFFQRWFGG